MRLSRIAAACCALALLVVAGAAWAKVTRIVTEDGPPTYHDFQNLGFIDGEVFAIHDEEWAVVVFWRPPEDIPAGHDLFNDIDPDVFDSEKLIKGFIMLDDNGDLIMTEVHGLGEIRVWFVDWAGLQAAGSDGHLFIEELTALDPLAGIATFFEERNHVAGVHQVSHLTTVARGTLEDGRKFDVEAVEHELEWVKVRIAID